MKPLLIIFQCWLLLLATKLSGQTGPSFEQLKLNSAPAYIMLGVEPDNIQRPSSPQQFIGGVQNAIVDGKLKPNIAIESTPYYWRNKPAAKTDRFQPSDYLLEKKNFGESIRKTFTFSLATSESDSVSFGSLKKGTGLGLGFRFTIVDGTPDKSSVSHLKKWNEALIKERFADHLYGYVFTKSDPISILDEIEKVKTTFSISPLLNDPNYSALSSSYSITVLKEFSNYLKDYLIANSVKSKQDIAAYLKRIIENLKIEIGNELAFINSKKIPFAKMGFILELAAGSAVIFQNNEWNDLAYAKTGIWLTPSYRWEVTKDKANNISLVDLAGVIRYLANNKSNKVDSANYLDVGIKGQFTHNKWSGSIEGVYRRASSVPVTIRKKYTYRLVSNFDYKLNDLITFKFSFGTNFDGNTKTYSDPKKMFAVGGLNLGLFNPKK